MRVSSSLEDKFLAQLRERKLTKGMKRELVFAPGRRFRFDFAWTKQKLAVEINGGVWLRRGGHTSGKGYESDMRKLQLARQLGWTVFSYTAKMVKDECAINEVNEWLKNH